MDATLREWSIARFAGHAFDPQQADQIAASSRMRTAAEWSR
jgi:hypothetical protein